jgi:hypothetical protein
VMVEIGRAVACRVAEVRRRRACEACVLRGEAGETNGVRRRLYRAAEGPRHAGLGKRGASRSVGLEFKPESGSR